MSLRPKLNVGGYGVKFELVKEKEETPDVEVPDKELKPMLPEPVQDVPVTERS